LIGGFIVTDAAKKVIIRAIGPSLPFAERLRKSALELHGPNNLLNERQLDG
jgi:hypothetical protein